MNLILAMLLGHALGDFYFQTNDMVSKKKENLGFLKRLGGGGKSLRGVRKEHWKFIWFNMY